MRNRLEALGTLLTLGIGASALLAAPQAAVAQASGVGGGKQSTAVDASEVKAVEPQRDSVLEDAKKGPTNVSALMRERVPIEQIERTETALTRLRNLVQSTPVADRSRAEYLFRLAELYYDRARYYEQRSYDRRDQAFELRETDPARSGAYTQAAQDDLAHSNQFAQDAISLYADLYEQYRDTYADIDAVLFYLGANLLQVDRKAQAREIFQTLAQTYPRSKFLPQAFFMLGELDFNENQIANARLNYERAAQFPDANVYPYALYKIAWCAYNSASNPAEREESVQLLYNALNVAKSRPGDSYVRLRDDELRDMTLFYSEVYPAEAALAFFQELSAEQAPKLVGRLARIYGDRAMYQDSNHLYRQLIELNPGSFKVVEYQREIFRNSRPSSDRSRIVAELVRLSELLASARTLPDATPAAVAQEEEELEQLLRTFATTYHSEAQTTRNAGLFSLAQQLYEQYTRCFGERRESYDLWFYYGEVNYENRRWREAAEAYEKAIGLGGGSGRYDEAATYAACAARSQLVNFAATRTAPTNTSGNPTGELPPIPTPQEIPADDLAMIQACSRYLDEKPEANRETASIEYNVAYTYYDYDHLDEAIPRFGRLALDLYQADPEKAQVSAQLLLDSLALKREFSDMRTWIPRFQGAPVGQGSLAPKLAELGEQVNFKDCRDKQQAGQFEVAGNCFVEFAQAHFESKLLDKALFNAAVSFEKIHKLDYSISLFEQIVEFRPDSELVPETQFGLAQTYHRIAMYDKAAELYEQYAQKNPRGSHVINALNNAYQFRQGLGQYDAAVANLRAFIRASDADKPEQRQGIAEANFQIAVIQIERGQKSEAISTLERFIRNDGAVLPSRAAEAYARIADLTAELPRGAERALQWYTRTLEFVAGLSEETRAALSPAALDAASKAQFMLSEQIFIRCEAIQIKGNETQVKDALRRKFELAEQAKVEFEKVMQFGRPSWMIAARTRTGMLFHTLFKAFIDAPVPDGLTPLQEEVYRTDLESRAALLKEKAMERYSKAIEVAQRTGWFNEYSEQAAARLQELDPTFKAVAEFRSSPGYDEVRFYAPEFTRPGATAGRAVLGDDASGDGASTGAPNGGTP